MIGQVRQDNFIVGAMYMAGFHTRVHIDIDIEQLEQIPGTRRPWKLFCKYFHVRPLSAWVVSATGLVYVYTVDDS